MEYGTVKRFNPDKKYGFIDPDGGGDDVHLHVRSLCDPRDASRLDRGVRVSYRVSRSDRGLRAQDVRLLPDGGRPDDEADVLTGAQLRDELAAVLAGAVDQIEVLARKHGWVE